MQPNSRVPKHRTHCAVRRQRRAQLLCLGRVAPPTALEEDDELLPCSFPPALPEVVSRRRTIEAFGVRVMLLRNEILHQIERRRRRSRSYRHGQKNTKKKKTTWHRADPTSVNQFASVDLNFIAKTERKESIKNNDAVFPACGGTRGSWCWDDC